MSTSGATGGAIGGEAVRSAAAPAVPVLPAVAVLVLGAVFTFLFWMTLERQVQMSLAYLEDWGHALLIPAISGYVIWSRRAAIAAAEPRVFWPGLSAVLTGVVAYFVAVVGVRSHLAEGLAALVTLFGVVMLLLGPAVTRVVFLPLAYLVFAVTLPQQVMIRITFALQQVASFGAWVMLSVIGELASFKADLAGNTIDIVASNGEVHPLNVAEACSGMRMVVAFYALAGAFALVGVRSWWQRLTLMALAGPVALLMNMIRVTVLGLLTLFDPELAAGNAHTLIGTVLLIPSVALFFGIAWALRRSVSEVADPAGGDS